MKNTKTNAAKRFSFLAIIALIAVIGFSFIACDDNSDNDGDGGGGGGGKTDSALNGTWIRTSGPDDRYEMILNNGNWEGRTSDGVNVDKGTYTANNGTMTTKVTHWWVNADAKWYTESEYLSLYPTSASFFTEYTWTYSISGNTFTRTRTLDEGDGSVYTQIWTKK